MYFLGTFAGQQATERPTTTTSTSSRSRPSGPSSTRELGIDAPIDGFMMTAKSPTLAADKDAAMAFLEYLSTGQAQQIFVKPTRQQRRGERRRCDGYSAFQKKQAEIIGARAASPSSSTATPARTSPGPRMQSFLQTSCQKPDQDLTPT